MDESYIEERFGVLMEEIRDALVGIKGQLENINATLIELKAVVDKNSKGRIIPLIDKKNVAWNPVLSFIMMSEKPSWWKRIVELSLKPS